MANNHLRNVSSTSYARVKFKQPFIMSRYDCYQQILDYFEGMRIKPGVYPYLSLRPFMNKTSPSYSPY